jgi:hypothetical protein
VAIVNAELSWYRALFLLADVNREENGIFVVYGRWYVQGSVIFNMYIVHGSDMHSKNYGNRKAFQGRTLVVPTSWSFGTAEG